MVALQSDQFNLHWTSGLMCVVAICHHYLLPGLAGGYGLGITS